MNCINCNKELSEINCVTIISTKESDYSCPFCNSKIEGDKIYNLAADYTRKNKQNFKVNMIVTDINSEMKIPTKIIYKSEENNGNMSTL